MLTTLSTLTQLTRTRLIDLRWFSIGGMLLAAAVSTSVLGNAEVLPRLLAFTVVVACLNGCLWLASHLHTGDDVALISPWTQLQFDVLSWSIFIYFSGGATNPLISVLLPLVAFGAIVLDRRRAWLLGLISVLLYSFLWRYYLPLPILDAQRATYLHLLGMWLVFVVSTVVSIWFIQSMSAALRERDAALALAREKTLQDEWLASIGTLAASAAHEMATPLSTLNLLLEEWAEDNAFPTAYRDDLALMRQQIERCRQTLNHLSGRASRPAGANRPSIAHWLDAFLQAWQATHPASSLHYTIAPTLEQQAPDFDIAVESALAHLLEHAARAGAPLRLQASSTAGALAIQLDDVADGAGLAPARAALARTGGTLHGTGQHIELQLPLPGRPLP